MPGNKEYRKQYYIDNKDKIDKENKEYKQKNKEAMAAYYRDYRAKNKEKLAAQAKAREESDGRRSRYMLKYYAENKDKIAAVSKEWAKANPDRHAAIRLNSVIRRRRLIGGQQISKHYTRELVEIYAACPDGHEVDHIVPLRGKKVSGLHVPWNLEYLPSDDNRKKSNHFPV